MRGELARALIFIGLGVLAFAALLAMGCSSAPVKITYTPGEPGKSGVLTAGEAARPQLRSVEITPKSYGRSCFDVEITPDGSVAVVYAVDASSDYAGIRVLPSILPEIVSAVMTVVGAPIDLIGQLLGVQRQSLPAPSALSACSAIYEN